MKDRKNLLSRLAAGVLVVGILAGVAWAAQGVAGQQGTQTDPLVTLSYIRDVVTPDILAQTGEALTAREEALKEAFRVLLQDHSQAVEAQLAQGGVESPAFTVVEVAAGRQLIGGAGCEIMLRSGSAICAAPTEPGLIDMTSGGTLASGEVLAENHLYMVTAGDRGLTAITAVTLLVRGSYGIQ